MMTYDNYINLPIDEYIEFHNVLSFAADAEGYEEEKTISGMDINSKRNYIRRYKKV